MSTTIRPSEKGSDDRTESKTDVVLIDEATIRRLEDEESDTDEPTCRFAAVARTFEQKSVPQVQFSLPATRVAYVDETGRHAVEREFFGHREDWSEIPRTIAVTEDSPVRKIPERHTARYKPILAAYQQILSEE